MRSHWIVFSILQLVISLNELYATKRAVIVAIGSYERAHTGWHNINSLNDIPLIDSILSKQGFTDVTVLKDEAATRDGIIAALKKLSKRTEAGDVVLVHFSSHGQLIEDENGKNKEEAIVAWEAPTAGKPEYKGEKHLLYRDIKALRDTLRLRAGPAGDVILFFDACHSGGLTRGLATIRGGTSPINIKGWKTFDKMDNDVTGDGYLFADNLTEKGMAPYVAISACKSEELNSEYSDGHCGSLSYVLSKELTKADAANETYTQLFASLLNDMYDINPDQHPVISGNTDRNIFAGQAVLIDPHFIIKTKDDNGNYVLNGGLINGLTKGSKLEAYPAGIKTRENKSLLFTVTVADNPDILSCQIKPDTNISDMKYTAYWFYISRVTYNGQVIRLSPDSILRFAKLKKELYKFFKNDTEVTLTSKSPQLILGYNKKQNAYTLYNSLTGALTHTLAADNNELKTFLINYAQYNALKKLNLSNESLSFSLDLTDENGHEIKTKTGGIIRVKEGKEVAISLSNKHPKPLYINIFNFSSDGTFELIKKDAKLISNLNIKADVNKPYGTDIILAVATASPLYLDALSAGSPSRGTSRSNLSSLQKIFNAPTTRSIAPGDEEGFTANLTFEIAPK